MRFRGAGALFVLAGILIAAVVFSLALGRYPVDAADVVKVLMAHLFGSPSAAQPTIDTVVWSVRLPRVLSGCLVGMALALAGLSYQTVFRNPLASPSLLGVSAGAAFGACLALSFQEPWFVVQAAAFIGGFSTVAIVMFANRLLGGRSIVTLVLCGIIVSALFDALVSIVKYYADPISTLPAITFWLMGGLTHITLGDLVIAGPVLLLGALFLYVLRWRSTALTLGDADATALGIRVSLLRYSLIICATIMTAITVSLAGTIGWVGLIVPHAARMMLGLKPDRLYPATALMGAIFVLLMDDIARSAQSIEPPLGVLTAVIGAPVFLLLLSKLRTSVWA